MKTKTLLKRTTAVGFASLLLATTSISYVSAEPDDSAIPTLEEMQESVISPDTSRRTGDLIPSAFYNGANSFDTMDESSMARATSLPADYSLVEKGVTTTVKNQGDWGTCWAFGGISSIESSILLKQGSTSDSAQSLPDYSERHLAWFTYEPQTEISLAGTPTGTSQVGEGLFADRSNRLALGGADPFTTTILTAWNGPVSESLVPYENINGGTETSVSWEVAEELRANSEVQIKNIDYLPSPAHYSNNTYEYNASATNAIKQSMLDYGVITISYAVTDDLTYFNEANSCQYVDDGSILADHVVSLVGWDDNYPKDNFNPGHQPEGNGAWLVKNSWSSDWALDGYFWLSYYDRTISDPVNYAGVTADLGGDTFYDHNYQYDYLSWMGDVALNASVNPLASANVFTAQSSELLEAVSVSTYTPGCSVEAYVYLLSDQDTDTPVPIPSDGGTLAPVATASDTYTYEGYHTLSLDTPVRLKEGQRFSVVEVVKDSNGEYNALTEHAEDGEKYTATAVCNSGESYLLELNKGWNNGTIDSSFTKESCEDLAIYHERDNDFGNAMIKAFTTDADTTAEEAPIVTSITCQAFDANQNVIGDALAFPLTEGANSGLTLPAGTAYLKINSIDRADRAIEDYNPFSITVNGSNYNLGDDISLANFVKAEGSDSPIVIRSTNFWGANERLYSIDFISPALEPTDDGNKVVVSDPTPTPEAPDSNKQAPVTPKSVKTGDTASVLPYLMILIIAGALILLLTRRYYKNSEQ